MEVDYLAVRMGTDRENFLLVTSSKCSPSGRCTARSRQDPTAASASAGKEKRQHHDALPGWPGEGKGELRSAAPGERH